MNTKKLISGDRELAQKLFILMAETFGEECDQLSDVTKTIGEPVCKRLVDLP